MSDLIKQLLPSSAKPEKIRLLIKGEEGLTVTLWILDGEQVATCDLAIGTKHTWHIHGNKLLITTRRDAMKIEYSVNLDDLAEIVK